MSSAKPPRDRAARTADSLAMLETPAIDTWVATASGVGRPARVQAWREANEMAGRTLMRDGTWLG